MPTIPWEIFAQYGIAGMILAVLLVVIAMHGSTLKSFSKDMKQSADQWRESFEKASERADLRQFETNTILRAFSADIAVIRSDQSHERRAEDKIK